MYLLKFKTIVLTIALMVSSLAMAQHDHAAHNDGHHHTTHEEEHAVAHGKHKIAAFVGFTHVDAAFYEHETQEESTGKWIPTLGFEYYYTMSKRFDLGLIADVELDNYYIRTGDENDLTRNNILVMAAVARYKPIHRLGVFAGPGFETEFIEDEESKSFFVFKVGLDYEVEIENGWEITPIISYDFKEEYASYSFGVSVGKRF
ncbi:hypothetical protein E9993_05065 [Labilibacter sediminis]|nr:hypothetical protein E9993_05065 [Labilibacter sediminis]